MTFIGANSTVLLEGTAHPTITDSTSGLTIAIGSSSVVGIVNNFAADAKGVVDLLFGVGGYTTAAQAQASLVTDGHGGSLLSLGGSGSIDFASAAPNVIAASHFKIGGPPRRLCKERRDKAPTCAMLHSLQTLRASMSSWETAPFHWAG